MKLVGDPDGIAALKALNTEHHDYLKFLIAEAQSNTPHVTGFRGGDGTRWELVLHPTSGDIEIRKADGA
ncbi:MAG TPA: hypothetical protein VL172_23355 [Kofleriaceae bacterium]|jgi:hypothetical protein|nr:hypothetical protein [Kofleriaceae bacterium]